MVSVLFFFLFLPVYNVEWIIFRLCLDRNYPALSFSIGGLLRSNNFIFFPGMLCTSKFSFQTSGLSRRRIIAFWNGGANT